LEAARELRLEWYGAAHYQLSYGDRKILIDPLYTRLPGDKPHLDRSPAELSRVDTLLLTHGHLDHSWDVPDLVAMHDPEIYAPGGFLRSLRSRETRLGSDIESDRWHSLDDVKGVTFHVADIEVTPYRIGTEEIDFWFIRSMFLRPWLHGTPRAIPTGIRWLTHHVFGHCFVFYFRIPPLGRTMLYFGNLTGQVDEASEIDRVDILAIPYCPANRKWLDQSQFLIERFKPGVVLVHHFDNFLNPFTLSKYMDLGAYQQALRQRCPAAKFYFSKFLRQVELSKILDS
jgi:L-ascorbate metabolism protein UlaG (beta-lactamase superfamily)